jgi:hypothetical protein
MALIGESQSDHHSVLTNPQFCDSLAPAAPDAESDQPPKSD